MSPTTVIGLELPPTSEAELLYGGSELPALLDDSGASYVVLGAGRSSGGWSFSPTVIATVLARRTERIGLVVAGSPQRDHPYNLARRVASVDHISAGRAGLLALVHDRSIDAGIGNGSSWVDRSIRRTELADALLAVRTLWRTWPISSLDPDPAIARAAELPFADHVGVFSTKGPLNVPTTPQGEPLVFWSADRSDFADRFATASIADVVLIDADDLDAEVFGLADETENVRLHVRVRAAAEAQTLSKLPNLDGFLLQPDANQLHSVLTSDIRALAGDGTPSPATTLRDRLEIPRRIEPDLSDHDLAFPALVQESV